MKKHIFPTLLIVILVLQACHPKEQLPTINIVTEKEIGWEHKEPCNINYFDNSTMTTMAGKIKCRGGFSSKFDKHSFSVELDKPTTLGQLPEDNDWILNANYIDKTFMRHKLCYDLFREMNSNNKAAQCAYVKVQLNSVANGLYVLMQKLDASVLKINKDDSLSMIFKDPPVFFENRIANPENPKNYYGQKFPKIKKDDKTYYIEAFHDFLFKASDEDFEKNISQWIDIQNVIDWHLLLFFMDGGDGVMKNFYLYKIDSPTPFRFAIWDCDHSFGRDGDNEPNWFKRNMNWQQCILLQRLMRTSDYPQHLKARWFELRKNNIFSNENIAQKVEENEQKIVLAKDENFKLWPVNSSNYYDDHSHEEEIRYMQEFIKENLTRLDKYFNGIHP
ncbi:MAG: CotH kinase family protein [Bacteroidales bacterium]|nr:CotH kinase family protein [Bacteroidales bacterium]